MPLIAPTERPNKPRRCLSAHGYASRRRTMARASRRGATSRFGVTTSSGRPSRSAISATSSISKRKREKESSGRLSKSRRGPGAGRGRPSERTFRLHAAFTSIAKSLGFSFLILFMIPVVRLATMSSLASVVMWTGLLRTRGMVTRARLCGNLHTANKHTKKCFGDEQGLNIVWVASEGPWKLDLPCKILELLKASSPGFQEF